MKGLFITGASGFIGRNLLHNIDSSTFFPIHCLTRNPDLIPPSVCRNNDCVIIQGSISDTAAYRSCLSRSDTVVHLAAATGKVPAEEYFKINTHGTRILVEECHRAKVKQFLYVSTIAVGYTDKSRYYYAESKELAEAILKTSRLNYTIVRPTVVIGKDSLTWTALAKLGTAPIIPVLGDGRATMQPIYIDDLIAFLLLILHQDKFSGEVLEVGGPEKITVEDLLRRIHAHYHGKEGRVIHIPREPLITFLTLLERFFYSVVPVTVGQLSVFRNDGTITANDLFTNQVAAMKNVDQMLSMVIGGRN